MPALKRICLAACLAALPLHATAAPSCDDWGTDAFFGGTVTAADVRRCLDGGAAIEARDEVGGTARHAAAMKGHAEAITALLDAGPMGKRRIRKDRLRSMLFRTIAR